MAFCKGNRPRLVEKKSVLYRFVFSSRVSAHKIEFPSEIHKKWEYVSHFLYKCGEKFQPSGGTFRSLGYVRVYAAYPFRRKMYFSTKAEPTRRNPFQRGAEWPAEKAASGTGSHRGRFRTAQPRAADRRTAR